MSSSKPVAVYLRVSTADQDHDSQREPIRRWLEAEGIAAGSVRWYEDIETGKSLDRKALKALTRDIEAKRVRTVVVYKLDRISRDLLDGMTLLVGWLEAGVRFASITQPIDCKGTVGKMVAAVLFGVAEIELNDRKQRQRSGIDAKLALDATLPPQLRKYRGRSPGTPKAEPARALELRLKGLTLAEIGQALGITERTVRRYLTRLTPPPE